MKKGCIGVVVVVLLLIAGVTAVGYVLVNNQLGLSEAAAVSHETIARPETRVRAVLRVEALKDFLVDLVPPEAGNELPDWLPYSVEDMVERAIPRELALLGAANYRTGEYELTFFLNERRGGPAIARIINEGGMLNEIPLLRWNPPGVTLERRGVITASASIPVPLDLESRVLQHWSHDLPDTPIRIMNNHHLELAIDNRNGEGITLLGAISELFGFPWQDLFADPNMSVLLDLLQHVHSGRLSANLEDRDTARIHVRIEADPVASAQLQFIPNVAIIPMLQEVLREEQQLMLTGAANWVEAEQALVGDFTLTGIEAWLERALGAAPVQDASAERGRPPAAQPGPRLMPAGRLQSKAWVVLALNAMYHTAEALCQVFVGVYFWINSLDFRVVCLHYLALYLVTPFVFILAGWYSQARDRVHVFRLGLALHAVYYGALLWLREDAASHPIALGVLLGVTWGLFWAGNNTFTFDVTAADERDRFFGWLSAITSAARLFAPLLSAAIIHWAPDDRSGYHLVFGTAVLIYGVSIVFSFRIPPDTARRPFRILRALFPGRAQRDWQWIMVASFTLAGAFHIFYFLLALLMYMKTDSAWYTGVFVALQGLTTIAVSYATGRTLTPATRRRPMRLSVALMLAAGALILWDLSPWTLLLFGILQAAAMPLFTIPHSSIRFDVVDRCADNAAQRIEYICAWEAPLALGRVLIILALIVTADWVVDWGVRVVLFGLCVARIFSYLAVTRISTLGDQERGALT